MRLGPKRRNKNLNGYWIKIPVCFIEVPQLSSRRPEPELLAAAPATEALRYVHEVGEAVAVQTSAPTAGLLARFSGRRLAGAGTSYQKSGLLAPPPTHPLRLGRLRNQFVQVPWQKRSYGRFANPALMERSWGGVHSYLCRIGLLHSRCKTKSGCRTQIEPFVARLLPYASFPQKRRDLLSKQLMTVKVYPERRACIRAMRAS